MLIAVLLPAAFPLSGAAQDLREAARLDAEGKCSEAERHYKAALAKAPDSPVVLNNAGNHYLICGQPERAEALFTRLLRRDPSHRNAIVQLARLAVERRQGAKALEFLSRLKAADPVVLLLKAEALYWAGRKSEARRALETTEQKTGGDPRLLYLLGLACGRMGEYERAERAFQQALSRAPGDFEILFQLGRAAARAGNYDRARRALETALRMRPSHVEVLVELGKICIAQEDYSRAVFYLAQARQRAPEDAEIVLLLARAAEDGGYYDDAASAYDEYLRLRPGDDAARRDRARACGHTHSRREEARKELEWYLRKHPDDPLGHYAYAQVFWDEEPERSLQHLTEAVRLDPNSVPIRYARAWMLQRAGEMAESLPDLEAARRLDPENARVVDLMGMAYLALDQLDRAEKLFREAVTLAPDEPEFVLHLGRALMALERQEEAQVWLEKYRKMRPPGGPVLRKRLGMIGVAALDVRRQRERPIEQLRREARDHPDHPDLQLNLASLLLADGQTQQALAEFQQLLALNAGARIWEDAGRVLLSAGHHQLARQMFERAVEERPLARLHLATALFYVEGPEAALECLRQIPTEAANGDVMLLEAAILEAAGRRAEAVKRLDEGLLRSATQLSVIERALPLLVRLERHAEALALLDQAIRTNPQEPGPALAKAVILGLMGRFAEAHKIVRPVQARWPELDRAYLVHGLLLERNKQFRRALGMLQTARLLGSRDPNLDCAEARLKGAPLESAECACRTGLEQLLVPVCAVPPE